MSDIYIIVEGQTERTFIRDILAPYEANKKIYIYPTIIGKPGHKGGNISFERATNDIGKFLKQRDNIYISTMFDYIRIDKNWPGMDIIRKHIQDRDIITAQFKAETMESATLERIVNLFPGYNADKRFIPYIGMHEFEALLFSNTSILAREIGINPRLINHILNSYNSPEEINDDPAKSPSMQLKKIISGYRKVAMGKIVAEAIGIEEIRRRCPHFNNWLEKLESLK